MKLSYILSIITVFTSCENPRINNMGSDQEKIDNYVDKLDALIKLPADTIFLDDRYLENDALGVVNIAQSGLIIYSRAQKILRLEAFYNGSHGDLLTKVYFKDDTAIFVRKILKEYNPRKFEKNPRLHNQIVNSYYLNGVEIIRYENNGTNIRNNQINDSLNLSLKFTELNKDISTYLKIAKQAGY